MTRNVGPTRGSRLSQEELDSFARENFSVFLGLAYPEINGNTSLLPNWHIDRICYLLSQVSAGRRRRQIFNMPPRTLKSFTISVAYTAWLLGRNPHTRIIVVSYGEDIATKIALDTKRLMESDLYRRLFPGTRLSSYKNSASEFETDVGGGRLATSIGGRITGYGADLIILDDPEKPSDMNSEDIRERTKGWYQDSVLSRFNEPDKGSVLVVTQRLHEDDLCSYLESIGGWETEKLPAVAEEDSIREIGPGEFYRFRRGDLLHAERLSPRVLDELKQQMGGRNYQAQYQQDPQPSGGGLNYWSLVTIADRPPDDFGWIIQSWDPAVTDKQGNSASACVTFKVVGRVAYVIDAQRFKLEQPELLIRMRQMDREWRPNAILVERNGVGLSICQMLDRDGFGHLIPITAQADKPQRLMACEDILRDGRFVVVKSIPQFEAYRKEFANFAVSRLNDLVDATTQVLMKFDRLIQMVARESRFNRDRAEASMEERRGTPSVGPHLKVQLTIIDPSDRYGGDLYAARNSGGGLW